MGAIRALLLSLKKSEDRELPDPLVYLSDKIQQEREETKKWYIAADVYRRHGIALAARYSQDGGLDFEKYCEEEISKTIAPILVQSETCRKFHTQYTQA